MVPKVKAVTIENFIDTEMNMKLTLIVGVELRDQVEMVRNIEEERAETILRIGILDGIKEVLPTQTGICQQYHKENGNMKQNSN